MLKSLNEMIAKWGRRVAVAAALMFSFSASAEWLWWTTDFTDAWGNVGELQENPAGEGVGGYDLYLVIENTETGDWVKTVRGGELVNDCLYDAGDIFKQTQFTAVEVSEFSKSEYVFFVEMVKSSETVYDTRFWSDRYSYNALVAEGHIAETIEGLSLVWNPAVGGAWSVPEPSGGVLTLLGFGFLMLRRKRRIA